MRPLFSILLVLIFLPAHAEAQLFVSEYNITYRLGEQEYEVEEVLRIKNGGDPFSFPSQIDIFRGDAEEMEAYSSLYGTKFFVEYEYPTRFVLSLRKAGIVKEFVLLLKYKRREGLIRGENTVLFTFPDLGTYPWGKWEDCVANFNECNYHANIRIVAPRGYQFGNITPDAALVRADGQEILIYRLTLLENFTLVPRGFPVRVEYADYETLAISELTSAKFLLSQSYITIADANTTLVNARNYDVDLESASTLLTEAILLYKDADSALTEGERLQNAPERDYYRAYLQGVIANDLATKALRKAAEAKNLANLGIQTVLESRIIELASNLSREHRLRENLSKSLVENLSERLREVESVERVEVKVPPPPTERNYYAIAFFALLGGIVLYGAANLLLLIRREGRARGTVSDFRVIGDLKRRSFKGFEKKVDIVKQEGALAAEIRRLQKDRQKYILGIENLKKKKIAKEIKKKTFDSEKAKFEKQIDSIDLRLEELESRIKKIKETARNEAGKAD
jgi:hypothetical protein